MGRPGLALDNAVIESRHSTLESGLRRTEHYVTRAAARAGVAAWIEDYNYHRRHSRRAGSPRWITSGRWRERTPREGGPAAARPRTRRRRLRRCPPSGTGCRAVAGGRAAQGYGVAPQRQGRLWPQDNREPSSCLAHVHARAGLDAEPPAAPGPGRAGRPSLPRPAARRVRCPGARVTSERPENEVNGCSIVRRAAKLHESAMRKSPRFEGNPGPPARRPMSGQTRTPEHQSALQAPICKRSASRTAEPAASRPPPPVVAA